MHILHVDLGNFRKLHSVRINFASETTVFVGANNSGKTSAMLALRRFLVDSNGFSIYDITLSHWAKLDQAGQAWETAEAGKQLTTFKWEEVMPFMDVWLDVTMHEIHYVQHLLPTLDWNGEPIGVRLRYEPKDAEKLQGEYLEARRRSEEVLASKDLAQNAGAAGASDSMGAAGIPYAFSVWPRTMSDFLARRLRATFHVGAYLLDPSKLVTRDNVPADSQQLPAGSARLEGEPFKDLIRVDYIDAQRGLSITSHPNTSTEDSTQAAPRNEVKAGALSRQLRAYFEEHLNPFEAPEPEDLAAMQAIHEAQTVFGQRLSESFEGALTELQSLGYPGVTDPELSIEAHVNPIDSIRHASALQYSVPVRGGQSCRLPETSNGLGYQNLVSIVFELMSFRDHWMRVGKAGRDKRATGARLPPLHLVLIEEPEAHLHAPVQQVFIRYAYAVLRKHGNLKANAALRTQLIVSTHSSHVAHAADFACLRYFRRLPSMEAGTVPTSSVVNLSAVFGKHDETTRFVERYIKLTHCDLFFADAAILVEGPAERIVLPHLLRNSEDYALLNKRYVTWLEIGGSHAHRLRPLLEHLALDTLIITDVDVMQKTSTEKAVPKRMADLRTRNSTLRKWIPSSESYDALLNKVPADLEMTDPVGGGVVRVAFQQAVSVSWKGEKREALPNTFEDALLYENIDLFETTTMSGLGSNLKKSITESSSFDDVAKSLSDVLSSGAGKAEFALDILFRDDLKGLRVPAYIREGLDWLVERLSRKGEVMVVAPRIGDDQ